MKKIFILFIIILNSCTTNDVEQLPPIVDETCYPIIARGYDERGNFIIIKYQSNTNKRYKVTDFRDYLGQNQICDLSNLIEQPL